MSKDIINQLFKMKSDLAAIYDSLEVMRDSLSNDTKEGTNKARSLLSKLSDCIDYQADLIILEDRKDFNSIKEITVKIRNL